ncbi:MAG: hypothetical protein JNL98_31580 [Bryobacterales bacterium]|nr:hypothetical protein [Bryobacterales bacterium]
MQRRSLLIAIALLVAMFASYAVWIGTHESLYTSSGTPAYWLAISRVIKDVPTSGALEPPVYYSSAGDGPKLPESAVQFRERASAVEVGRRLEEFACVRGYQRRAEDGAYVKGTSILSWEVTPGDGFVSVTVRENE